MQVPEAASLQGVVEWPEQKQMCMRHLTGGHVATSPLPLSILETLTQGFVHAGLPTEL